MDAIALQYSLFLVMFVDILPLFLRQDNYWVNVDCGELILWDLKSITFFENFIIIEYQLGHLFINSCIEIEGPRIRSKEKVALYQLYTSSRIIHNYIAFLQTNMAQNLQLQQQVPKIEESQPIHKDEQLINVVDDQEATKEVKDIEEPIIQVKPQQPEAERLIQQNKQLAETYKAEGNQSFKKQQYFTAIQSYQHALQYAPLNQVNLRAILYSNISVCLNKQNDHKEAIEYCKKSIKSDPTYMKAQLNLALGYQKTDNPEEALVQYKKLVEINPNDYKSLVKVKQLEKVVQELNEKRKNEVLDGLKTIGNNVLGFFGLSLDNFKLNQTDNGGYNVSYKN